MLQRRRPRRQLRNYEDEVLTELFISGVVFQLEAGGLDPWLLLTHLILGLCSLYVRVRPRSNGQTAVCFHASAGS